VAYAYIKKPRCLKARFFYVCRKLSAVEGAATSADYALYDAYKPCGLDGFLNYADKAKLAYLRCSSQGIRDAA
jgi:hypothetical protein